MKLIVSLILGIVLFGMLIGQAFAISVVSDFLENNTIIIKEHDSKTYGIRLSNPKEYPEFFRVEYDSAYATITDYQEQYEVAPQSTLSIKFNVSADKIPKGETVSISYTVHQISGSGEGVPLLLKISKSFKAKVEEAKPNSKTDQKLILLLIIILAYAAFRAIKQKKPKKKKKRKEFL